MSEETMHEDELDMALTEEFGAEDTLVEAPTPPCLELKTDLFELSMFPTVVGDTEIDPTRGLVGYTILDAIANQLCTLMGNNVAQIWSRLLTEEEMLSGNAPPSVITMFDEHGKLLEERATDNLSINTLAEVNYAEILAMHKAVSEIIAVHQEKFPMRRRSRLPVGVSLVGYIANEVDGLPYKVGDSINSLSGKSTGDAIKKAVQYRAMTTRFYKGMVLAAKKQKQSVESAPVAQDALAW